MRITAVLLMALSMALAPCCASAETKLMVVSDIHYMDPSLYQGSELFLRSLRNGDGKITQYSDELIAALYQEIIRERPDALIVTGDLTFNGEKKSHLTLAGWFADVEEAGIPVWVIPGNHDINSNPVRFEGNKYYGTEAVTPEDFAAIYADFMEPGEAGFSYLAKTSDKLWVAMTDVSCYQQRAETYGMFSAGHAAWLEKALKSAQDESVRVVSATHHSLIAHTAFYKESFLMSGNESMAALAEKYGMRLNLSGHLHIQHIARDKDLTDAALGAFCIWPHRYALVTLGDSGLVYEAKSLSDLFLPEGFLETSKEWFAGIARDKASSSLTGTDEENRLMADYVAKFNLAYFAGTYRKDDTAWTDDPGYALWERHPGKPSWMYMKLLMGEATGENLHWDESEQ